MSKKVILIGIGLNTLLASLVVGYLNFTPKKYTSNMTITLNGNRVDPSVVLQGDKGTVNPGVNLTYAGGSVDPRAFYDKILNSDEIFEKASKGSKYSIEDMKSSIKTRVILETPNIAVRVKGNSPEEAREKARLFYEAFNKKIEFLRDNEKENKEKPLIEDLNRAKINLNVASKRLEEFRIASGLAYEEQVPQLIASNRGKEIELTKLKAEIESRRKQTSSFISLLNVTERSAIDSLNIQVDPLLKGQVNEYVNTINSLKVNTSKFTEENPVIVNLEAKRVELEDAIESRTRELSNRDLSIGKIINLVSEGGSVRTQMYSSYLNLSRELEGLEKQYEVLNRSLKASKELEVKLISSLPTYKNLVREYEAAGVIYSNLQSTNKLRGYDRYALYPLFQLSSEPSLPSGHSSPNTLYAVLGGVGGTFSLWGLIYIRLNKKRIVDVFKES
ncbi:hypothetical protein H6G33_09545 [Calothrix sp. FACHB-1219]|uniref:hypothetical protein n=1 Tax=unclassified Calothrix TaxID=2619626 RepID=UPI001689D39E|nr:MULTISPECIES: hypothetical protein [unclassified Calothrix]MBD2201590.1 hypothetical protein [Calothrix sp. FACHB-168]MBD2217276.1 hypothetical protein [Calothrix sp. FACHB-1219]